jgi:hypothetical protein
VAYLAQPPLSPHDEGMSEAKKDAKKAAAGRAGGLVKSAAKTQAARANGAAGAKQGGQAKSEAKTRAARINRTKGGGRPKGLPITTEHARKAAAGRAAKLTPERRSEIARLAVAAREAKRKKSSS